MEYYSAIKRNAFESDLVRCLNLEPVTEWSKSEKETQISYINVYTYIWNLKKWYGCTYLLEKAMAPHSSTLAWKIPWTEEPGGLQSMGLLRVGHDWATSFSLFHFHALEKEMATHSSVLAWRIPGAGEPGGRTSMGSHRVGHDWSDLAAAACLQHYRQTLYHLSHQGSPRYCKAIIFLKKKKILQLYQRNVEK